MKTMKFYLGITILILLSVNSFLFAQLNTSVNGNKVKRTKIQILPNGSDYFSSEPADFGVTIEQSATVIARSIWSFDVPNSIPAGSEVYKVEFTYTKLGSNTFNFGLVTTLSSNPSYSETWNAVENMTVFGNTGTGTSGTRNITADIQSVVQQAVNSSNKQILIGFKSNTEFVNIWQNIFSSMELKIYYNRPVNVIVSNNFNAGQIKVNGAIINNDSTVYTHETKTHTFEAIEPQSAGGYSYVWNDTEAQLNKSIWERVKGANRIDKGSTQSISQTMVYDDNGAEYVANLRKMYNLTFSNPGMLITLNGNNFTSSVSTTSIEENSITATCYDYTSNQIAYTYQNWICNGNTYSSSFTPTLSGTYTANYTAKPFFNNRALSFFTNEYNAIILKWGHHPVCTSYRVYRSVGKTNPTVSLLTTTSDTTFTDPEYINTGNMEDEWIHYDVRPIYTYQGITSESDPSWAGPIFGLIWVARNENIKLIEVSKEVPSEYSMNNYPNPFNPTTTINYQLPKDGMVTIKVYDILGKEIAELVNESKSAGYYKIDFEGSKLTSGIYIATIQANNFSKSIKLLLTK